MSTQEHGHLHINPSGWPAMDSSVSRYQLSSHHEAVIQNACEMIDTPLAGDLDEWNPYNVPWDTTRSSRVSRAATKPTLSASRSADPDTDGKALVQEDEWYCDSGSSSSSTSSNERTTPRRSGVSPPDDRSRQSDTSWRARPPIVDDTTTQKRNKKSSTAATKKYSQSKDTTTVRQKVTHNPSKDEERVVRTDEIALFMRCKKRPCDVDVQPIPPAPGGWDDVVPEGTCSWGTMKNRNSKNNSEKLHHDNQPISNKRYDSAQGARDERNKGSGVRNATVSHHSERQNNYAKPNAPAKATSNEDHAMMDWGKSTTHAPEVSQPWREKFAPESPIKKNDIPSSYYNTPLPMENNTKHGSGQLYQNLHIRYSDMNASQLFAPIGDVSQTRSSHIDTLRHWLFEKEGTYTAKYANDDGPLSPNDGRWQSTETFASPWDSQPKSFANPRHHPPSSKERKGSLDSLRNTNRQDFYIPASSTQNTLHFNRNKWSSMPSIWSVGPDETNHVRTARRSSFDVGNTPATLHGMNSVDWSQSGGGLDDWSIMNKRVGSLMRLLEEDVTPLPTHTNTSIPHEHSDTVCHSFVDERRDFSSDNYAVPKSSCSHCGASNRVLLPTMRSTYLQ